MNTVRTLGDPSTLIGTDEVVTSSTIRERLVGRGLRDDHARQTIRRLFGQGGEFWRSESLILPRGERLFARRSFFGGVGFYRRVGEILAESRPGLSRCLAILAQEGVLNRVQAHKLLASPVLTGSGTRYPGYASDVAALKELGVKVRREETVFEHLVGAGWKTGSHTDELAARSVSALRREVLLTRILVERSRRQNMISWGGAELPGRDRTAVEFNNQYFSAYGFSHLGPVRRAEDKDGKTRLIPCPVLFDIHAGNCSLPHVQSFLQRAERATWRGSRQQAWMGMIAAREFAKDAWLAARTGGLLTVNFRQMFGDEALEAMAKVEQLLEAFQHDADPGAGYAAVDSFTDALKELKVNPVVVDLRSIGFEVLAGMALRSDGYEGLGFGQMVPFKRTKRDVDVHASRGREVRVVECKAYHSGKSLTEEDVAKFYEETLPAFIAWWTERNGSPPDRCMAEIWTSGRVGGEAKERLDRVSLRRNVAPRLLGAEEILGPLPGSIRERCSRLIATIALTVDPGDGEPGDLGNEGAEDRDEASIS